MHTDAILFYCQRGYGWVQHKSAEQQVGWRWKENGGGDKGTWGLGKMWLEADSDEQNLMCHNALAWEMYNLKK